MSINRRDVLRDQQRQNEFTLLELVVVIAIIATATVAVRMQEVSFTVQKIEYSNKDGAAAALTSWN